MYQFSLLPSEMYSGIGTGDRTDHSTGPQSRVQTHVSRVAVHMLLTPTVSTCEEV